MSNIEYKTDIQKKFSPVTLSYGSRLKYAGVQNKNRKVFTEAVQRLKKEVCSRQIKDIQQQTKTLKECLTKYGNDLILRRIVERNMSNPSPYHKSNGLTSKERKVKSAELASKNRVGVMTGALRGSAWQKVV